MKTFIIKIYGVEKKSIQAITAESAVIKASFIWCNGNTRGISAVEVK